MLKWVEDLVGPKVKVIEFENRSGKLHLNGFSKHTFEHTLFLLIFYNNQVFGSAPEFIGVSNVYTNYFVFIFCIGN